MKATDFRKEAPGRVVQAGPADARFGAFVPNPLPPRLTLDPSLVRKLSDADRAVGELAGLGRNLPNPHLLIGPFIRREAVLSSRIEGTRTDLAGLYAFEAGQLSLPGLVPSTEADAREVLNYVRALEYGLQRVETFPVSLRLVRELHERLMTGVRGQYGTPGEFRTTQNWIGAPGCTLNDATFVPPPPDAMQAALADWETYLHAGDTYPPLLRLALIHYQFEAIHPFVDGNGRVGRLLISLLLVHWDILPSPLLYLSAFLEQHRQAYYDHLLKVSQTGAWMPWIEYFLVGIATVARDARDRARRLLDLQETWRRQAGAGRSATRIRLVESLFELPVFTIPQIADRLEVAYPTARSNVEALVLEGVLAPLDNRSYGRIYVAPEILNVLSQVAPGGSN